MSIGLPNFYGFNFQWIVSWREGRAPSPADERALDFLAKHGFNFVRIPCDYRYWTNNFDYLHPNEKVFEHLDRYFEACRSRGLHFSLNLHRAPGYCINSNHLERDNLWLDEVAQDGFVFLWRRFAERYRQIPPAQMSFDLLNEPPEVGLYGMTRDHHEALTRRTVAAIRFLDPARPLVIDGLDGGNLAMPELADLGIMQSCRGYQPMTVSHYKAEWWSGSKGMRKPVYPGGKWMARAWNREALLDFYKPWAALERLGNRVYVGEFGCYRFTPNEVALRWLEDLFSVFKELTWGYAMWEFSGNFGIIGHGRPGARTEKVDGYEVDVDLLELMKNSRTI